MTRRHRRGKPAPPSKRFVGVRKMIFEAVMAGENRTRFQRMLIHWTAAGIAALEFFGWVVIYVLSQAALSLLNAGLTRIGWNPLTPWVVYIMQAGSFLTISLKVFFSVYGEYLLFKRETKELEKGV